ncbi:NGG1p interacting factor NIF3, partial [bacterium]|nr:NGG1p interacting factor NIF3 [bacterium]
KRTKKKHAGLKGNDRDVFDAERLTNPYADSRILHGADSVEVKSIIMGIDMETPEVLLTDRLQEKGAKIDLIWGHHPEGGALANLSGVMAMQADILHAHGVPINIAEGIMGPRIKQVERGVMVTNHMRAVDAARILDIPMICTHTPADNCVATYLQTLFDTKNPETVGDVLGVLRGIPEYAEAEKMGAGLKVFVGGEERRTGRVLVDMTGGTGGSDKAFEKLAYTSNIGTIVGMHISEKNREQAKKHHINVVIAGHIASDTLGMNILLDGVEKAAKRKFDLIECSGFRRHRH